MLTVIDQQQRQLGAPTLLTLMQQVALNRWHPVHGIAEHRLVLARGQAGIPSKTSMDAALGSIVAPPNTDRSYGFRPPSDLMTISCH